MEKGIQDLKELAVLDVIYRDSNNKQSYVHPDQVQCTQSVWQKFLWSVPSSYAKPLALMSTKEEETLLQVIT